MAAWNAFSYICTRALHAFRSFAHCRAASTVTPLLPKATFTPSIQPNLGLPPTRSPLISAINTLLAIRYSSILSTCPNHLNTLWSALLANFLSIPALLGTSSFLTLSIVDTPTKLLKHFISRPFTLHWTFLRRSVWEVWLSHILNFKMEMLRYNWLETLWSKYWERI